MSQRVFPYDPNGIPAEPQPSVKATAKWLGVTVGSVTLALSKGRPCKGYMLRKTPVSPGPWGYRLTDLERETISHHATMAAVARGIITPSGKKITAGTANMAMRGKRPIHDRWMVERI
jgi:hypothetical protein